jgi:hypothetical protein
MTMLEMLCSLRQRRLNALEQDKREEMSQLYTVFSILVEASYEAENRAFSSVLEDLEYSAQHGSMGVKFKAVDAIPSIEAMREVCSKSE